MSNNKQSSSVDFFWNQLPEILPFTVDTETAVKLWEAFEQAKAMHKDEHAATARDWWVEGASDAHKTSTGRYESFHDYYEKKFNQ